MSCENENVEYWRLVQKYSTISGVTPTIPPSQDHSDGTWSDTDLYIGEFFMNVSDNLLWYRTIDGIHLVSGATGASGSFVGDYVPTSGGTYSGGVFAPTFSSNTITSALITASAFDGQIFGSSGSVFYGDGSNLTGIVVGWNGGTVSNGVDFVNNVSFGNPIVINGPISTVNDCVDFQSDVCVNGGVSASYFIGDGSGLTGIVATYSDTYTTDAYLQGSSIYFDRTNGGTASYFVDLTPILATYSILDTNWDPSTSEFQITTNGGDTFTETINEFASLNVLSSVTANQFYGTFNGTFSNDIYTTSATLYGTDAVFVRTDGASYSLDLSTLSTGGATGATGPAGATGATGSTPYMVISYTSTGLTLATGSVTLPITTTLLIGWSQGTRVRIWNDATHYMEGQVTTAMTYPQLAGNDIVVNVDYVVGTGTLGAWKVGVAGDPGSMGASASQTLAQTLVLGNNTGNNDIELNNSTFTGTSDGIVPYNTNLDIATFTFEDLTGSGSWAPTIKLQNGAIKGEMLFDVGTTLIQNTYVSGPINRYGELRVTDTSVELSADDLATGDSTSFDMASTSMVVSSTTATFQGVEYASDYSANFTNRSLVDKEYVDNAVAGGGLTWSGLTDSVSFFDSTNSLSYTNLVYNSGRFSMGDYTGAYPFINAARLAIEGKGSGVSGGLGLYVSGDQFGGQFIADGPNGGQNIGLQAQASNGQISGNLGFYSLANGTASSNIGGYFVAYGGTIYPGYGGYSNLGLDIYVDSNTNTGVGVTNSGINVLVGGRVGDNNYIGQLRDGSEGVGKVLTCISADGLATWQTPTGGGGSTASLEVLNTAVIPGYRRVSNTQKLYRLTRPYVGYSTSTTTINGESIYLHSFYCEPGSIINEIAFRIQTAGASGLGLAQCRILIYRSQLNASGEIVGGDLELDTNVNVSTLSTGIKVITGLNHTLSTNTYKNQYFIGLRNYQSGSLSLKSVVTSDTTTNYSELSSSGSIMERDNGWYFSCLWNSATPTSMPAVSATVPTTSAVAPADTILYMGISAT